MEAELNFSAKNSLIEFRNPILIGTDGVVDPTNCVIKGVSLITNGVVAKGHNLKVDDTTLNQLHALGTARGKIPVNLDHGSGIKDTNGYVYNFRIDGGKWKGDWQLLQSHDETPKMLERAKVMPECFGMSVAFIPPSSGLETLRGGGKAARAGELKSIDCVRDPAANAGLFSEKVDSDQLINMANENQNQEPTLAQIIAAINDLKTEVNGRLDAIEQGAGGNELSPEEQYARLMELNQMTDEQLAAEGISRDQVDAATSEWNASIDGQGGEGAEGAEGSQGAEGAGAEGAMAGAGAGSGAEGSAAGGAPAAFNALYREVMQLKAESQAIKLEAKNKAEQQQFSAFEQKAYTLAAQRDQAVELCEKLQAENECLQLAVRTGTRPVKPGQSEGVRLFSANGQGELHPWQEKVQQIKLERKCTEGQAISFCDKDDGGALHKDYLESLRPRAAR